MRIIKTVQWKFTFISFHRSFSHVRFAHNTFSSVQLTAVKIVLTAVGNLCGRESISST